MEKALITKCIVASLLLLAVALVPFFYFPRKPGIWGYKSPRSVMNASTWRFSYDISRKVFLVHIIIFILLEVVFFLKFSPQVAYEASSLYFVIGAIGVIPITEMALRIVFDENGKTRKYFTEEASMDAEQPPTADPPGPDLP